MGRKDLSPRELFQEYLALLKRESGFRDTLINIECREAFDKLLEEAWLYNEDAIVKAGIPCIMDALILLANIHNKKNLEDIKKKILKLEKMLKNHI